MSLQLTTRRVLIALALGAVTAAVAAAHPRAPVASGDAGGHTAAHRIRWIHLTNNAGAGRFFSYDGAQNMRRNDRDWPITLVFYRNASIDKVKTIMDYRGIGSIEYEGYKTSKSAHRRFDRDGGRKKYCNRGTDTHFRVYAPSNGNGTFERLWDPTWGYYVVGSTHYDHGECGGSTHWYGLSEQAEFQIVVDAREIVVDGKHLVVRQDFFGTRNKEPYRRDADDSGHRWQNSGRASAIKIP